MKLLFVTLYAVNPHFETDLELILNQMHDDNDVHVFICRGNLKTCLINPDHKHSICILCESRIRQGLSKVHILPQNLHYFIEKYPEEKFLPKTFRNVQEIMQFEYDGLVLGPAVASSQIFEHEKDVNFDTIKYKNQVYAQLRTVQYIYITFCNFIKENKIEKIIFFNGRFSEFYAIYFACQKMGISYATHERAGVKQKYILKENTFPQDPNVEDEINSLWNSANEEEREKESESWFIERRVGNEQSWYSYIIKQKNGLLPDNFDKSKTNIVIYDSTMEESFTISRFSYLPIYKNEIEGIKKIFASFEQDLEIRFYLRIHPHMSGLKTNQQLQQYYQFGKIYKNVTVIEPDSPISTYTLMDNCDKVITFSSTVGIEAAYWGKPVILVYNTAYRCLNATYKPETHEELILMIKADLSPKPKEESLKYAYWERNRGYFYQHFVPTSLDTGLFDGERIVPTKWAYLKYGILRIFDIRTFTELKQLLKQFKNRLFETESESRIYSII